MAGRPRIPNADFKVILHQTGGYRYAATQPYEKDDKTGKIRRHYVYWGDVTEEMKFIPNQRFCLTDSNTRGKLEFPESWDLSAIEKLTEEENRRPLSYDPSYENDGSAFSGTVRTTAGDEQFNNRFYGGTWFLWEMAVSKHVVEDLLSVFDGNQLVVNDIMTLAMFPIMTKRFCRAYQKPEVETKEFVLSLMEQISKKGSILLPLHNHAFRLTCRLMRPYLYPDTTRA